MGCTYLLVRSRRCCDCDQGRAAIQWDDRKMIHHSLARLGQSIDSAFRIDPLQFLVIEDLISGPPNLRITSAVGVMQPCLHALRLGGQSPQQLRVGVLAGTQKIIGHDSTLESSVLSGYHVPMSLIDTRINLRLLSLQERDLAVDLGGLVIIKGRRDCGPLAEKLHESFCRRFLASRG